MSWDVINCGEHYNRNVRLCHLDWIADGNETDRMLSVFCHADKTVMI